MANRTTTHYFVISYDADYELPYGFAWFADIGSFRGLCGKPAFTYYATREEAFAASKARDGAVLLDEDKAV
jgi:hypothetical protein